MEPGASNGPFPLHRGLRYAESLGRLANGQAAEVPELDDSRLLRVELRESAQRTVDREHVGFLRLDGGHVLGERDSVAAVALLCEPGAGVVDQDLTHEM